MRITIENEGMAMTPRIARIPTEMSSSDSENPSRSLVGAAQVTYFVHAGDTNCLCITYYLAASA